MVSQVTFISVGHIVLQLYILFGMRELETKKDFYLHMIYNNVGLNEGKYFFSTIK